MHWRLQGNPPGKFHTPERALAELAPVAAAIARDVVEVPSPSSLILVGGICPCSDSDRSRQGARALNAPPLSRLLPAAAAERRLLARLLARLLRRNCRDGRRPRQAAAKSCPAQPSRTAGPAPRLMPRSKRSQGAMATRLPEWRPMCSKKTLKCGQEHIQESTDWIMR